MSDAKRFPPREVAEAKAKEFAKNWFPMSFHESDRGAFVSAAMHFYFWLAEEHEALLKEARAEAADTYDEILSVIDRSGNEQIYNWGSPLREIRAIIEKAKAAREGK